MDKDRIVVVEGQGRAWIARSRLLSSVLLSSGRNASLPNDGSRRSAQASAPSSSLNRVKMSRTSPLFQYRARWCSYAESTANVVVSVVKKAEWEERFEEKRHVARLVCDDPCTRPTQVVPCIPDAGVSISQFKIGVPGAFIHRNTRAHVCVRIMSYPKPGPAK
ncbi:hypothetical protein P171DRAFT_28229 [Karstenula rhodostoma CBS 690.94]|uniref:Uncharacterized protein n=1 Tax=Karstenula rhodostoma CBS 690.94 TaxID=1392251 RepID=A0A9P4PHG4_9PLEO|nr:hypothetical protein P171DRAFT_28229 [Karstenula rhodostoma CBS 690.94]